MVSSWLQRKFKKIDFCQHFYLPGEIEMFSGLEQGHLAGKSMKVTNKLCLCPKDEGFGFYWSKQNQNNENNCTY